MTKETNKKNIGDYIKQIGAYGILLTFFTIGLAIAGAFWSSTVTDLNNQIGNLRTNLNNKTDELNQVKSDYLTYKTLNESVKNSNPKIIKNTNDTISTTNQKIEIKTVNTEKSERFFGGDLIISLIATPFEGSPIRHKVLANISSPTGKVIKVTNEDIGKVINYVGKENYKITILAAETYSATFQVTR